MQRLGSILLALGLFAACSGAGGAAEHQRTRPPTPDCWSLAPVPGPEDLVLDASADPPRLLVSSRPDLRKEHRRQGAIWAVPLEPGEGTGLSAFGHPLTLTGRDGCSFHPHGVSLVRTAPPGDRDPPAGEAGGGEAPRLLYVINHHEEADASKEGCILDAAARGETTSVEVFRVERNRLRFVQRLHDPEVLTGANDLVALPDGRIFVTNPPTGLPGLLVDVLSDERGSELLRYDCARRGRDLRCAGSWSRAWRGGAYLNGIAYSPADDGDAGRLYAVSTAGKRFHVFEITPGGKLHPLCAEDRRKSHPEVHGDHPLCRVEGKDGRDRHVAPGADNLAWHGEPGAVLLTAAHPDTRRFLQHTRHPGVSSPSQAWRIPVDRPEDARVLFEDDGDRISAASTAILVDGDLVLGQVFGRGVLRCRLESERDGGDGGAER